MKKIFVIIFSIFFSSCFCFCLNLTPVDNIEARIFAEKWLIYVNKISLDENIRGLYEVNGVERIEYRGNRLCYVYHLSPQGHILVPAYKEFPPVKSFSTISDFNSVSDGFEMAVLKELELCFDFLINYTEKFDDKITSSLNQNHLNWDFFQDVDLQKTYVLLNNISKDTSGRTDYFFVINNKTILTSSHAPPLLQTNWNQGDPYWNFCPKLGGRQCYVGCTATAMVQIMRYYKWPHKGEGRHTYYWSAGGRYLSVDFSDDYDWNFMPHNTEDYDTDREKNAVAELCYEAGVSVNMSYGPDGSGAYIHDVDDALKNHFRYLDRVKVVYRSNYGNVNLWFDELKKQRDLSQPVEFAMYSTDSGHAVVIDGYLITSGINQVHINMGWGGGYNAYYTLDDILDFTDTYWQHAVIDIIPPCEIKLNKSSLSFTGTEGQANPNEQRFQVRNSGLGKMEYHITPDKDWISTSPNQGQSSGEWDIITVFIDITDLLEGSYTGNIEVSSQGARNSPLDLAVDLTVKPPPIYAPLNFSGEKVKNTSGFQMEFINVLRWEKNAQNRHIEKYRIYFLNGGTEELLVELDAEDFKYMHRDVIELETYRYFLKAVDYKNREGEAAYIEVK